jgi:hypothetical protein
LNGRIGSVASFSVGWPDVCFSPDGGGIADIRKSPLRVRKSPNLRLRWAKLPDGELNVKLAREKSAPGPERELLAEKGHDESNGLTGLFFHDPVAGVLDDGGPNVARDKSDLGRQFRPVGMIAADREHRFLAFIRVFGRRLALADFEGLAQDLKEGLI